MTTTENAGLTARQLTAQAAFDHVVDVFMQHLVADMIAHLGGEGVHQQYPGIGLANATLAHVEHGLLVELARGSAM